MKTVQKILGDDFENPKIDKRTRELAEELRSIRMDRIEFQQKETDAHNTLRERMQKNDIPAFVHGGILFQRKPGEEKITTTRVEDPETIIA